MIVVTTAVWLPASIALLPELVFVAATIVTGPATLPLFKMTEALPPTVDPVAVVGVASFAPMYSPPPGPFRLKLTAVPSEAGSPLMSFTRNTMLDEVTCPVPAMPITAGVADTNSMLPVVAGVMVKVRGELVALPATAVTFTDPEAVPAVNVVLAVPLPLDVNTVVVDKFP